jgi:hypothetical protein
MRSFTERGAPIDDKSQKGNSVPFALNLSKGESRKPSACRPAPFDKLRANGSAEGLRRL